MSTSVIIAGVRTPIGKLSGSLAPLRAVDLGAIAIAEVLERAGIDPASVDYVVMGHVLQAGQGQATARQAATKAGIPMSTPATTVNKVCLSGLNSIHLADLMVRSGDADIVVAGGMESMTNAPYVLPGARAGFRFGDQPVLDVIQVDGLVCAFEHVAMGEGTDHDAEAARISRERQDDLALKSHLRAADAIASGRLGEEIVPVTVTDKRASVVVETDEGVRANTTADKLAALKPAFNPNGAVTAGNASQISDGAAAVIVTSRQRAEELGVEPLCELVSYGQVAGPDVSLLTQPSRAILDATKRGGISLSDIDLFEINEAFAAVSAASIEDLGIDDDVVNVNGGAIALGHPIGMSGARLALTLAYELRRRGGGTGAAALCGGG
ncbi:MAG: acetyl-CoA C-acetyltransferase, partial [Acidimicrobiales bacterium]